LQHVAGGEADMDTQGEMHEYVRPDGVREQDVVRVHENHISSGCGGQPVERSRRLAVVAGAPNDDRLRIAIGDRGQDTWAFVRGSIVDDDAFDVRIGLLEHAVNGLIEEAAVVVIDNDDADQGQTKGRVANCGFGRKAFCRV